MKSSAIVERQVASQRCVHVPILIEPVAVEDLRFHGMEEGFDKGVVSHLPGTVHALGDPEFGQTLFEDMGGVFNSPIGVENQSARRFSVTHRTVQGRQRQGNVFARTESPTHDPPGAFVHHHGQVAIDATHFQVRDVAHPDLVRSFQVDLQLFVSHHGEAAFQGRVGIADQRHPGLDPVCAHDPRHPVFACGADLLAQSLIDARASVQAAAALKHLYPPDPTLKLARTSSLMSHVYHTNRKESLTLLHHEVLSVSHQQTAMSRRYTRALARNCGQQ